MCLSYDVSMNSLSSLDVGLCTVAVPVIANQYFTVTIKSPKTDTILNTDSRCRCHSHVGSTPNQTNNNKKP